jgi:hypothetical protein
VQKRCKRCFRRSRKADGRDKELSEKSTMRFSQRLIAAAVLIALSSALAGCGGGGFSSFDPTDLLDWLDTKKKLPGDRKPVFPEGVPGLEQGVPKSLYKGSAQEQIDQQNARAAAAAQPAEPVSKSPKSKGRGKQPATASTSSGAQQSPAEPDAAAATEEEGGTAAAPPAPKAKKIVRKRTTAPPPDAPTAQSPPATQPAQQSASPFPAPVPGTVTR